MLVAEPPGPSFLVGWLNERVHRLHRLGIATPPHMIEQTGRDGELVENLPSAGIEVRAPSGLRALVRKQIQQKRITARLKNCLEIANGPQMLGDAGRIRRIVEIAADQEIDLRIAGVHGAEDAVNLVAIFVAMFAMLIRDSRGPV